MMVSPDKNTSSVSNNIAPIPLPPGLTELSLTDFYWIFAYFGVFLVAGAANLWGLVSVCRILKIRKSSFNCLLCHLSIADCFVVFTIAGGEVLWRISIAWRGGVLLCKVFQFCRTFGLHLSSLIVASMSLDRFFVVVYPLQVALGPRRIKIMIGLSYVLAIITSLPQAVVFTVESHPTFPTFKQCNSVNYPLGDRLNTALSLFIMYFLPLVIIIFSYGSILWTLFRTSNICSMMDLSRPTENSQKVVSQKTKVKTLKLTCFIVAAFFTCSTPYVVIATWHTLSPESITGKIGATVQEILFLLVLANSVVNPFVYRVTYKTQKCLTPVAVTKFTNKLPGRANHNVKTANNN